MDGWDLLVMGLQRSGLVSVGFGQVLTSKYTCQPTRSCQVDRSRTECQPKRLELTK